MINNLNKKNKHKFQWKKCRNYLLIERCLLSKRVARERQFVAPPTQLNLLKRPASGNTITFRMGFLKDSVLIFLVPPNLVFCRCDVICEVILVYCSPSFLSPLLRISVTSSKLAAKPGKLASFIAFYTFFG